MLFRSLSQAQLDRLGRYAKHKTYSAGEQIFQLNQPGHEMMLIANGQVKVTLPVMGEKVLHLATMGRGQFFGEMSFMDGAAYSADVYAVEQVQIISIANEAFNQDDQQDQTLLAVMTKAIALALAQRLRQTNSELLELKSQS